MKLGPSALACVAWVVFAACANSAPRPDTAPSSVSTSVSTTATTSTATGAGALQGALATAPSASSVPAPPDAGVVEAGVADAGIASGGTGALTTDEAPASPAPLVADNKVAPTQEAELQARAKGLLDAIIRDEPALGDPFWFPREPFIPLKDVKGPDKYWAQLHRSYASDIHALHKKRKSWDGVTFERVEIGSTPKWVKPGDEANKIGYYRSFRGKLRFLADGKPDSVEVHTVITWQGRWYVTHLRKFKK